MKRLRLIICLLLCSTALAAAPVATSLSATSTTINSQRPDVQAFIKEMVDQHQFNRAALETLFDNIKVREDVLQAMKSPYEAKPWYIYRQHFMTPARIDDGVKFWQTHREVLEKIAQQYGVPIPIIVAIIGVESHYGQRRGQYPVLDTLATFAFDYPSRQKFFRRELAEFLLLSRDQKWEPSQIKGSYAGAVGQAQFMPSSYRLYAVDYANKGHIDLFDNLDDIIASVANYLAVNGWQRDKPIATLANVVGEDYKKLTTLNGQPKYTLSELLHYGIHVKSNYPEESKVLFFFLDSTQDTQEYWVGFTNLYVITRYNSSKVYALAVMQLSQAIESAYQQASKQAKPKVVVKSPVKPAEANVPPISLEAAPPSPSPLSRKKID